MRSFPPLILAALIAGEAAAETLRCEGTNPAWELALAPASATFAFAGREGRFDIPQSSVAAGAALPRAMTLIAPRDSAIVIVDDGPCATGPLRGHVLTQRGETPILLTGCCREMTE